MPLDQTHYRRPRSVSFLLRQVSRKVSYLPAIVRKTARWEYLISNYWRGRTLRPKPINDGIVEAEWKGLRFRFPAHSVDWFKLFLGEILVSDIYEVENTRADGEIVVDCGANVGIYSVFVAHALKGISKVIAVEPFPENVEYLYENIRLNGLESRVTVVQAAVSRREGTARLAVLSSGGHHLLATDSSSRDQSIQVVTVTLDQLHQEHGPIGCVKMDVEGAELDAVTGADHLLRTARPSWRIAAYHSPTIRRAVHTLLTNYGYHVRVHPAGYLYADRLELPPAFGGQSNAGRNC